MTFVVLYSLAPMPSPLGSRAVSNKAGDKAKGSTVLLLEVRWVVWGRHDFFNPFIQYDFFLLVCASCMIFFSSVKLFALFFFLYVFCV